MKRRHLNNIFAISTLSAVVLLTSACTPVASVSGQADTVPLVKVIKLSSLASAELMENGKILPYQEVKVVSKISGKVAQVLVDEGAQVQAGQELIKLESDDYVLQIKQAHASMVASEARVADVKAGARMQEVQALQAGVRQAEAAIEQMKAVVEQAEGGYDLAKKTFERTQSLFQQAAVSQAELDRVTLEMEKERTTLTQVQAQKEAAKEQLVAAEAKLSLAQSGSTAQTIKGLEADLSRAQTGLELAENTLHHATIAAPIAGTIVQRNIEPGEMAQAGSPLLSLVKMDTVKLEVSVAQEKVNEIKVGDEALVQVAGLERDGGFKGIVEFISPISDPNSSRFPVKIKVANPDGLLKAGMVAQVAFTMDEDKLKQMEVPKSALIQKEDKNYVYKLEDNTVHLQEVQVVEKNKEWVWVQQGLSEQDQVVVQPDDGLSDGRSVRVQ